MKIYTVTEVSDRPTIKLTGKWLEEVGFKVGDKVEAIIENNMLILIKITPEEGKTKRQALTCVMRRIINIIFNILSKGVPYEHPNDLNTKCLNHINQKKEQKTDKA